ncbi:hypothetical protein ACSSNL_04420 [Thalassobius sp. S69A]|uniref:hypothetical protein n=1 Tax=unclassified Thalassovita TaxID=2619711 RepID=UPI003C7D4CED
MTDYKELIERLHLLVPIVTEGQRQSAHAAMQEAAYALEAAELAAEGAAQIIATERAEVIALRKQLEAATAEQVAVVKPLKWSREVDGSFTAQETLLGEYTLLHTDHGLGWLVVRDGYDDSFVKYPNEDHGFATDKDAKDWVDGYHAQHVLSAITLRSAADVEAEARAEERAKVIALIESYPANGHGHLPSDPYEAAHQVRSEILSALHTPESLAVKEGK